jgi:hypothetical protein
LWLINSTTTNKKKRKKKVISYWKLSEFKQYSSVTNSFTRNHQLLKASFTVNCNPYGSYDRNCTAKESWLSSCYCKCKKTVFLEDFNALWTGNFFRRWVWFFRGNLRLKYVRWDFSFLLWSDDGGVVVAWQIIDRCIDKQTAVSRTKLLRALRFFFCWCCLVRFP